MGTENLDIDECSTTMDYENETLELTCVDRDKGRQVRMKENSVKVEDV